MDSSFRSVRTSDFKSFFSELPARVQKTAINRYKNYFALDPFHALLGRHNLKDVGDAPTNSISFEIAFGYRAVAFFDSSDTTYVWYWCGTHSAYDVRFREGR